MSGKNTSRDGKTRRNVLRSIGGAGVGVTASSMIGGATETEVYGELSEESDSGNRRVKISGNGRVTYEFSVTGVLTAVDAPKTTVDRGTAEGELHGEEHEFVFSGEFTAFDASGNAEVVVDGEPFDYETFPHERLELVAHEQVSYDISASGAVEQKTGPPDESDDQRITGTATGRRKISYAGELTYFDVDGDITIRKNGREVDESAVLPSTDPHELTVRSTGSNSQSYSITLNGEASHPEPNGGDVRVEGGTIEGVATSTETTLRYSGSATTITHPDAGVVEIRPEARELECKATAAGGAHFDLIESVDAHDSEEPHDKSVTLSDGESERLSYHGDLVAVSIRSDDDDDGFQIELERDAYSDEVERSYKLQFAAELEREREFQQLQEVAQDHGRVRRDAGGIVIASMEYPSFDSKTARAVGAFALTDHDRSDQAVVTLAKRYDINAVYDSKVVYQWRSSDGFIEKFELNTLRTDGLSASSTTDGTPPVETETVSYNVDTFREIVRNSPSGTTAGTGRVQPQFVHGDVWDEITDWASDLASGISGVTSSTLESIVDEVSSVGMDDIVEEGGRIAYTSFIAANDAVRHKIDSNYINAAWQFRVRGLDSVTALYDSGLLQTISNDDENVDSCTGCVATVRVLIDAGACGYAVPAIACSLAGAATLSVGGIACATFFGAVCNFVDAHGGQEIGVTDAENLCGNRVSSVDDPLPELC